MIRWSSVSFPVLLHDSLSVGTLDQVTQKMQWWWITYYHKNWKNGRVFSWFSSRELTERQSSEDQSWSNQEKVFILVKLLPKTTEIIKIDSIFFDRITLQRIDCNRNKMSLFHLSFSSAFVVIDIISMICLIADIFFDIEFRLIIILLWSSCVLVIISCHYSVFFLNLVVFSNVPADLFRISDLRAEMSSKRQFARKYSKFWFFTRVSCPRTLVRMTRWKDIFFEFMIHLIEMSDPSLKLIVCESQKIIPYLLLDQEIIRTTDTAMMRKASMTNRHRDSYHHEYIPISW